MGAERRESPAILAVKHGLPKHAWHHHLHLYNEDIDMCEGLWWTRTWISVVKDGYGSSVAKAIGLVADAHPVVQIKVVGWQSGKTRAGSAIHRNQFLAYVHARMVSVGVKPIEVQKTCFYLKDSQLAEGKTCWCTLHPSISSCIFLSDIMIWSLYRRIISHALWSNTSLVWK